jgi:hypothetical protein
MEIPKSATLELEYSNPERNLIAEVLNRALRDVLNQEVGNQAHARCAMAWLRLKRKGPFSFNWICKHLDICPEQIRKKVKEMKEKGERFPP